MPARGDRLVCVRDIYHGSDTDTSSMRAAVAVRAAVAAGSRFRGIKNVRALL